MEDRDTRRPGRPRKEPDEQKKKYARVSPVDRCRIIDVHRRGGDLKVPSETLGINIKTVRSIAATDRDTAKTRGGSSKKFGSDVVDALQQIVQENPSFTLEQIKRALKEEMPNIEVSTSTIDRLLDGHGYSVKLLTQRPVDRNRADVKHLRRRYAQWLQSEGTTLTRCYIDETNFNVWCSRSFGRAKRGAPACRLSTSAKGANVNVIACMSANGLVHWTIADKVHWAVFNDFLAEVSRKVCQQEPGIQAVFLFDNAPAHHRAEQAFLAASDHTVKWLPPYSPFFNPIEELFSKFKAGVKGFLSERRDDLLTTPGGISKKEHRRALLVDATGRSMQHIQRVDYSHDPVALAIDTPQLASGSPAASATFDDPLDDMIQPSSVVSP
ncbi:hypothetical protein HPB52_009529 [Rhipicephalus sanguineus]|uniref:Tc1-like transposase DDE domain-containing protein n=1 Tax=Rhipicephalus sanguineus TaxID=34632 RepID=A0A9D4Q065_RHISA|nr:hypothetical protein HPB52_009529 [Rhipicephalus sanguineus]